MADPEIQKILQSPEIRTVMNEIQRDPAAATKAFQNPDIAAKLTKLIEAGIIRTGWMIDWEIKYYSILWKWMIIRYQSYKCILNSLSNYPWQSLIFLHQILVIFLQLFYVYSSRRIIKIVLMLLLYSDIFFHFLS